MIGNNKVLNEIEEKLKEIAELNRKRYGHIIDLTDIPSIHTEINLGWIKYDNDEGLRRITFDFISGYIYDCDNDKIHLKNLFFEMGQDFEKKMKNKINIIKEMEKDSIFLEKSTKKRLDQIIEDVENGFYDE